MNSLLKAHLILLITAIIGGFNYSISKIVMPAYVQPSAIILLRGFSSILFFWLIHALFIKEKIRKKKDFVDLFLCALFGITTNQILFYEGLNLTAPINAALLQCSVPVFVMLISAYMIKEKITAIKIAGLILSASGAVLLLMNSGKGQLSSGHTGDIMMILNAASYALFLVMVKPLTEKYNPFTVVKWIFLIGTILSLPFGYQQLTVVQWEKLPVHVWWALGFIVVFATLITYYLNVGVLRYVNASIAGIYVYLIPVFASIIAVALGQDNITWEKVGYSVLIFGGVYFVSKRNKTEEA